MYSSLTSPEVGQTAPELEPDAPLWVAVGLLAALVGFALLGGWVGATIGHHGPHLRHVDASFFPTIAVVIPVVAIALPREIEASGAAQSRRRRRLQRRVFFGIWIIIGAQEVAALIGCAGHSQSSFLAGAIGASMIANGVVALAFAADRVFGEEPNS